VTLDASLAASLKQIAVAHGDDRLVSVKLEFSRENSPDFFLPSDDTSNKTCHQVGLCPRSKSST
jgi:hypothetical protein